MFLITTKKDNRIIDVAIDIDYGINGYPRIIEKNLSYVPNDINVCEVSELPQEVEVEKWCYTEAEGFYPNPNYREPSAYDLAPTEVVDAIIDEYTNELIEMGVL